MSELPEQLRSLDTHESDTLPSFLDFLLGHPVFAGADPSNTEVYFDLDETLFIYERDAPEGQYIGSWRSETPQLIDALRQAGFAKINVLSSKSREEIDLAMALYSKQFGAQKDVATFDELLSTRDYEWSGNKYKAFPEVARQAAEQARHAIFVDDARLHFDHDVPFGFVNVPPEMQYRGEGAEQFVVSTPS